MASPSPRRPARVLAGVWLATAVLTGLPGLLLRSFAEDAAARRAALLLLLCAGLALATALFVHTGTRRVLLVSLGASALILVTAGGALVVLASDGSVSPTGAALFGGATVVGAGVAALLAGWRLMRPPATPS